MAQGKSSRYFVGSLVIVGALVALVASGMKSNTMRAVPVDQLRKADSSEHSYLKQRLRVVGYISKEPVRKQEVRTEGGTVNVAHFRVEEKGQSVQVVYSNALPDTFRAGGPVQVDGVYVAPGKIEATHVYTKCPSKYEQGEGGDAKEGGYKSKKDDTAKPAGAPGREAQAESDSATS